ncbi:MAG: NAD-dependent protein deacetylase [Xanthomonadales bacterium]|nr:NAD-dependent protein deacetylase [Xanthomonadales bacterium]
MLNDVLDLLRRHPKVVALTGAGISAASGIPTYRDDDGRWRGRAPIQHQQFIDDEASRRRYWARSMHGWRHVADARPNAAHHALAALEQAGVVTGLVTQNVDRLHQRAGQRRVVDLHGRLDRVLCLDCGFEKTRAEMQRALESLNPAVNGAEPSLRPDGDAEVEDAWIAGFRVPPCPQCDGVLMPDVVFFGGSVPRVRVEAVVADIAAADALLVAGSSLAVYSGYRFCLMAVELGKPLVIVNRGPTRADGVATLLWREDCTEALPAIHAAMF